MSRPNLSYLKNLVVAAVAIPLGVLTGITGVSGASILQPLLSWLLGVNGAALNGLVLAAVSYGALSGMLSYIQVHDVSWSTGLFILFGVFIGSAFAAAAIRKTPIFYLRVRNFWSLIPLVLGALMILKRFHPEPILNAIELPHHGLVLQLSWSILAGITAGFLGQIGELGSIAIVPLLVLFAGTNIVDAQGTALFVLVLVSLPTVLVYALKKQIDTQTAISISLGAIFGALYGSHTGVYALAPRTLLVLTGSTIAVLSLSKLFQPPTIMGSQPSDGLEIKVNSVPGVE